jgi:hypothetical protein
VIDVPSTDARPTVPAPPSSSPTATSSNATVAAAPDRDATLPPPPSTLLHLGRNPGWTRCGARRAAFIVTDDGDLFSRVKSGAVSGGLIREVCPGCDPVGCQWRAFGCTGEAADRMTIRGRETPARMCSPCASLFDSTVGGTTAAGARLPATASDDFIRREPLMPLLDDALGGGR